MAILADGTVMTWGSNLHGELGTGGRAGTVSGLTGATAISAGTEPGSPTCRHRSRARTCHGSETPNGL